MKNLCIYLITFGVTMGIGCAMRHAWINGNRFCVQDIPKKVSCGRMGITGGLFGNAGGVTTYSLGYSGTNSKTQKECVSWHLVTEAEYSRRMYAKEKQ